MNLITFDKTTKRPVTRDSKPFITVSKNGKFNFSQGARRLLGLNDGDRAILHQDAVFRSDWYMEITRNENGYKIVLGKTDTRFTCTRIAVEIFKSIGRQPQKMSFPIASRQSLVGNMHLWVIETKKPL
ncbi:MAG: hypothetical protein JZU47_10915 [Prolixibacteraceae bacterium]|nr:hypothetical protein [Prolixibacteraceae bacterium]